MKICCSRCHLILLRMYRWNHGTFLPFGFLSFLLEYTTRLYHTIISAEYHMFPSPWLCWYLILIRTHRRRRALSSLSLLIHVSHLASFDLIIHFDLCRLKLKPFLGQGRRISRVLQEVLMRSYSERIRLELSGCHVLRVIYVQSGSELWILHNIATCLLLVWIGGFEEDDLPGLYLTAVRALGIT